MQHLFSGLVELRDLVLQLMPLVFILGLLLAQELIQLVHLRLDVNRMLRLLLLFDDNLRLHLLAELSDSLGLILSLAPEAVPLFLDLP